MALNALQASQLSTLLAGHAKMFTANNPGQNEFADYLLRSGQAATMGLLAEEEEKKRKKKEKGILGGKIGSALGTAAGIALAPATGGASMALAGAAGGAIGGLGGQLLSGGSPNVGSFAMDAAQGGLTGYQFGKQGELASAVETGATQPDVPASPPIAEKITDRIANAIPGANTLSRNVPAFGSGQGVFPQPMQQNMPPMRPGLAATPPLMKPGVAGVTQPAQRTRPGFGSRFGAALEHVLAPPQTYARPSSRFLRRLPDGTEIYE